MSKIGFINAIYYKNGVREGPIKLLVPIEGFDFDVHYTTNYSACQSANGYEGLLLFGMEALYNSSVHQAPYGYNVYSVAHVSNIVTIDNMLNDTLDFVVDENREIHFTMTFSRNVWASNNHTYYIKFSYYHGSNKIFEINHPVIAQDFYYGGRNRNSCTITSIPWINTSKDGIIMVGGRVFGTFLEDSYEQQLGDDWSFFSVRKNVNDASSFNTWIEDIEPIIPDDDNPYWEGGTSEEGGGNGNFSEDSDNPETDELPGIDAIGTGFATIFKPSKSCSRC